MTSPRSETRRASSPVSERRIRPSAIRRLAFWALGLAAVAARAATFPWRRSRRHRAGETRRVFIFEPFGLGDAIALQPLVAALCREGANVTVGTRPEWFPVFPSHPNLSLAACVPPWIGHGGDRKYGSLLPRLRRFLPLLRRHARGREGIDPRGDVRSILALYAAGCTSVDTLSRYFTANDCLVMPLCARRHPVRRDVLRWRLNGVFAPDLPLSPPSLRHLLPPDAAHDAETRGRSVALLPMSSWPGKQWTPEAWNAVSAGLRSRGLQPVVLCGPGEEESAREAAGGAHPGAPELRICPDVPSWASELAGRAAAIAVNTGPMHVAAAVGTPVVLLEGPSRQPLWAPAHPRCAVVERQEDVECAPCHQIGDGARCGFRCMRLVTPAAVLAALDELLATRKP